MEKSNTESGVKSEMDKRLNLKTSQFRYFGFRKELQKNLAGFFTIGFIFFLASCAANPVTGEHQLMLLSEKDEIQLGHQTDGKIVEDYGTYQNQELVTYIDNVGRKMARLSQFQPGQ